MRPPFELIFANDSSGPRTVCLYLTLEDPDVPGVRSLAWLVARAAPTTEVAFRWCAGYAFTWANTGLLRPGAVFTPVQVWSAGPPRGNEVTLTCWRGTHQFRAQKHGPDRKTLVIVQDAAVLPDEVSVGIAVGATPAFAVQARPRTALVLPPPSLACRIAAGDFVQGEALDHSSIRHSALVPIAPETPSITATLDADLQWAIAPTA
jgi:rhizosphere induced protein